MKIVMCLDDGLSGSSSRSDASRVKVVLKANWKNSVFYLRRP